MPESGLSQYNALILREIQEAELPVPVDEDLSKFALFLELLIRWNGRLNLSAVREPQMIVRRHFVESIFAAQKITAGTQTLLDYGSGGGFPGVIIALCRPEIRVTLAESQNKKASFLREASRVLGIGAAVFDKRVETMAANREFEAVTMRAVEKMENAIPVAASHASQSLLLLATAETAPRFRALAAEFDWAEPMPLPASESRVLLQGIRA